MHAAPRIHSHSRSRPFDRLVQHPHVEHEQAETQPHDQAGHHQPDQAPGDAGEHSHGLATFFLIMVGQGGQRFRELAGLFADLHGLQKVAGEHLRASQRFGHFLTVADLPQDTVDVPGVIFVVRGGKRELQGAP